MTHNHLGPQAPVVTASLIVLLVCACASQARAGSVADAIRAEALLPPRGEKGRPLPLAAHWNRGTHSARKSDYPRQWEPAYQMELIDAGHHLLPWFSHPPFDPGGARDLTEQ